MAKIYTKTKIYTMKIYTKSEKHKKKEEKIR